MATGFTIRIFVPEGDPEGVRIIDRMNWTGRGYVVPRDRWVTIRDRPDLNTTGVYILYGYSAESLADEDSEPTRSLPTVYIGQSDVVSRRIDSHLDGKLFWERAVIFVSSNAGLNRGHATWLEHMLIKRASEYGQCLLDNGLAPQEPNLSEAERADTSAFLLEMLQILPVVGVRVFEAPRPIAQNLINLQPTERRDEVDTIVVPAQQPGFNDVFLGRNEWYAIRISAGMIPRLRYIAGYQTQPVSAITHIAAIDRIEPYGESAKYRVIFSGAAQPLDHIPLGTAPWSTMQGPRYTSSQRIRAATTIGELFQR